MQFFRRSTVIAVTACLAASVNLASGGGQAAAQKPAPKPPAKAAGPAVQAPAPVAPVQPTPGAGPIIVVETVRGTFEFETYPADAPKTVEHVVALVKKNFYNGQRFHRAVPGFVVQVGDPQSRDMSKREWWGRGDFAGSGRPVGVAEFSKKHLHVKGAVAMAHSGNAADADAQFYVTLATVPRLNGKYAVFGQVISGFDVPAKIQVGDMLKRAHIRR
jgi:cyclophilin family peptidyl-prolyl cis-trans isomerase